MQISSCILFSIVRVIIESYQLQALNKSFPQHFHRFQVTILPETSLTSIAQIKLSYHFSFSCLKVLSGCFKGSHFVGSDPSNYSFCYHYFKGIPSNVKTKTVVTIHDPVTGYYLKLLHAIYEIIFLDNLGVLPEYIFEYCISHIGSN